jgi:hypothetical protein
MFTKIEAYENDIQLYVELLKPYINIKDSGFNTQGGFG